MLSKLTSRLFGSSNERQIKKYKPIIDQINNLENEFSDLSDEQLKLKTKIFKDRLSKNENLKNILPEAFATVREASKRTLKQRHFDVQLTGGMVLHEGKIAEMKTGEGKTLVATLACYLNALEGKGVHVVTVNDYLARRDSEWMGQIYNFLGMTVGCIISEMDDEQRRIAYNADITYGTNNEFGFDYLRDNMKYNLGDMVQRPFNFAIVDEVDSILIDEARTPLVISGQSEDSSILYKSIDKFIPSLNENDYELDEKQRTCNLTDSGIGNLEKALLRLTTEGYRFKAIYDFKGLGKCKKKFITEHIQWEKETWLKEIADSTVGICPTTHYTGLIRNSFAKFISRNRIMRNDYVLQYKNTSNASRAFIFHQLKIPVITEIGGSMHHILGDEKCGYICYSENSWYSSIKRICMDDNLNKEFSEKAYYLMKNLIVNLIGLTPG